MKRYLFLLWLAFLIVLSGCAETAHAPEDAPEEKATPSPTATFSPNTAVIFKRSGGINGTNEEWVIFTDGRIETNSSTQPQLSAEQVSQLLSSLESTGFFELATVYLPEDSCCDRFLYKITAVQNNTFHSVSTLEATPDMPEPLQQSLQLILNALFESNNQ